MKYYWSFSARNTHKYNIIWLAVKYKNFRVFKNSLFNSQLRDIGSICVFLLKSSYCILFMYSKIYRAILMTIILNLSGSARTFASIIFTDIFSAALTRIREKGSSDRNITAREFQTVPNARSAVHLKINLSKTECCCIGWDFCFTARLPLKELTQYPNRFSGQR